MKGDITMSQIKILGESAVITSTLKAEGLETLKKFKQEHLTILNDRKEVVYAVGMAQGGRGSVTDYGITFNNRDAEGFAQVTITLPDGIAAEERANYVAEKLGNSVTRLNGVEEIIQERIDEVIAAQTAMVESIQVLG